MLVKIDSVDQVQLAQLACKLLNYTFISSFGQYVRYRTPDGKVEMVALLSSDNLLLQAQAKGFLDGVSENKAGQYSIHTTCCDGVELWLVSRSLRELAIKVLAAEELGSEVHLEFPAQLA